MGDPFAVNGISADQVILNGALASRADDNDTIDLAVLAGLKNKDALKDYDVVHFQPFDPVHKLTQATVKAKDGKTFKVAKGAPQVILKLAGDTAQVKPAADKAVNDFAVRGFRSLGVARSDQDGPWRFLGVLPLFDPPRDDAKATVAEAVKMGVKIKMVTGDALAIAKETAKKLDMGTNILDAASLGDSKKEEADEVAKSIEKADGFAQVFPEHKYHIIDVLQKRGHIVGMTGDGVNDSPALKKADCGIAVSGATDAARAAAAIVLVAPGLSVIIDAIKESRKIFQRMNSYAIYRIAETLRVLFFMTLAILVFKFYPVTAVMIVMIALLNDGAILSIAYDNVHYRDTPEAWNMRTVLGISTVLGVIGVVAAFGLFYLGQENLLKSFLPQLDRAHIQTLMYLKLSVAGHLTIFLTRTRGPFWSIRPAKILWGAVLGTQIVATLIAVFGIFMAPLSWKWAAFVWGYALLWFLVNDRVKLVAYRILDRTKAGTTPETKPDADGDAKTSPKPEAKMETTSEDKANAKPEIKADPKPAAKPEVKPEAKAEPAPDAKAGGEAKPAVEPTAEAKEVGPKPEAKAAVPEPESKARTPSDLKPQIAKRAYELYEARDHKDDSAVQDWEKAEREIRKGEAGAEPKPEANAQTKPEAKAVEPKPEANMEAKPDSKTDAKADAKPASKSEAATAAKPEAKAEAKTEDKAGPQLDAIAGAEAKAVEPKPEAKVDAQSDSKADAKTEATPEIKADPKPEAKDQPQPEAKIEPKSGAKAEPQPETKTEPDAKADSKAQAEPETKDAPKPEAKVEPRSDVSPQLVERVHKLYEELGREDVRAVQESEKAAPKIPDAETKK